MQVRLTKIGLPENLRGLDKSPTRRLCRPSHRYTLDMSNHRLTGIITTDFGIRSDNTKGCEEDPGHGKANMPLLAGSRNAEQIELRSGWAGTFRPPLQTTTKCNQVGLEQYSNRAEHYCI